MPSEKLQDPGRGTFPLVSPATPTQPSVHRLCLPRCWSGQPEATLGCEWVKAQPIFRAQPRAGGGLPVHGCAPDNRPLQTNGSDEISGRAPEPLLPKAGQTLEVRPSPSTGRGASEPSLGSMMSYGIRGCTNQVWSGLNVWRPEQGLTAHQGAPTLEHRTIEHLPSPHICA